MWKQGLWTATLSLLFVALSCGETSDPPESSGEPANIETSGEPANMMIIETSLGNITCELFPEQAPMTVDVITGLAEGSRDWTDPETGETMTGKPYYDGIIFHRVIPDFMIQTGDPTGTGTAGPGFQFEDEFHQDLRFDQPGRLAMANRGPNTNGGQIFITVVPTPHLDFKHTIFGQVVEGQDVADAISEVPAVQSRPNEEVSIIGITVVRGEGE